MPTITAPRPVAGESVATLWGQQVHDAINQGPRYVPSGRYGMPVGMTYWVPSATTAANIGLSLTPAATKHSGESTAVWPAGAIGVSVIMTASHSVASTGHRFNVYDYDAPAVDSWYMRGQLMSGKSAGSYETLIVPFVACDATGRIKYEIQIGTAGTTSYFMHILGWWFGPA